MDPSRVKMVLQIKEIFFYEYSPESFIGMGSVAFYWRKENDADWNGPFPDLLSAIRNYDIYSKMVLTNVDPQKLISINFKTRKRI